MIQVVFWILLAAFLWAYLGYPVALGARRALFGSSDDSGGAADSQPDDDLPGVSVVLAVRNEAESIDARLENLVEQRYPEHLLEVVVVANGCTDDTVARVEAWTRRNGAIRLLESPADEGKAGAINRGAAAARGQVLVFADARQRFDAHAIRELVRSLERSGVGAVSGRLVIEGTHIPSLQGVLTYWAYETWLRSVESDTGSVVGATGAIYAMERKLYSRLPPNLILDDVYLPVRVAGKGRRVIFNPKAIAYDRPASTQREEYRRKVRTMVGNFQLMRLMPELLIPGQHPLWARYVSHKLLRVLAPIFLLGTLLTGLAADQLVYTAFAYGQLGFYLCGVLGLLLPLSVLSAPAAFVLAHGAVLHALLVSRRDAQAVWAPRSRPDASG